MEQQTGKRSKTVRVLSIFFAVLAGVGASAGARYLMTPSDEQKAAELVSVLQDLAARENPASPKTMENGLKLLSVKAEGKVITYTYSVPPTAVSTVRFGGALRDGQLQSALCSGPARQVVQAGAKFTYVYLQEGSSEELSRSSVFYCV